MRVLVTGGGGFLGGAISRRLLARGDEVVVFQRRRASDLESLGATSIKGDLQNSESVHAAVLGCDAVIHTAAKAGPWGAWEDFYAINAAGTETVLEACKAHRVRNLVYTSSPSVVHGGGDIEAGNESLPYPSHFKAAYPETKAIAERMVRKANSNELRTTSLRPHLIWGPQDPHLLPRLLDKAARGTLRLPAPEKLIDTVYIDNAAAAHLQALDELTGEGRCAGRAYFITNDEPMPLGRIVGLLLAAAGQQVRISAVSPKLAYAAGATVETIWKTLRLKAEPPLTRWTAEQLSTAHWFDITSAKQNFGYTPEVSIDEGLQRLSDYFGRNKRWPPQ